MKFNFAFIIFQNMSYQNENFGMMDQGYFVPRTQILDWLNNLLHLNLTKIEQLGSGAVYCQVVDVIHPGKVALSKVNWKARNDYEFINNLKILQNSFDKIGIKKHLEIERLAKAKYQDNLELIQWLKRYYDLNCGERGNNYLPEERRGNAVVDFGFAEKNVVPKTYGGSGVVKNQPVQKKKTVKQEDAPMKVKSPGKKVETRKVTSPVSKNIKGSGATIASTASKKTESGVNTTASLQKTEEVDQQAEKQLLNQLKNQYEERIDLMFQEEQTLRNQLMGYKQSVKHTEMKIDMIREIMKGEDEAIMKLSLIQQIIND